MVHVEFRRVETAPPGAWIPMGSNADVHAYAEKGKVVLGINADLKKPGKSELAVSVSRDEIRFQIGKLESNFPIQKEVFAEELARMLRRLANRVTGDAIDLALVPIERREHDCATARPDVMAPNRDR